MIFFYPRGRLLFFPALNLLSPGGVMHDHTFLPCNAVQCNTMQCFRAFHPSMTSEVLSFASHVHYSVFNTNANHSTLPIPKPKSHGHANSTPHPSRSTGLQAAAAQPASCTAVPKKIPTQPHYCIATVLHKPRAPSPYPLGSCDRHTRPSARHCDRPSRSRWG